MTNQHSVALWDAFRRGEAQALATLFEHYYDALYGYGLKLTSNEELVKDGIQNLFQKLWRRRSTLGPTSLVKAYLFKALRRHLADETKLLRRYLPYVSAYADAFEVTYSHEEFLISQQTDEEQRARLLAALNRLSKRQREALYLRFFDNFSYERVAEVMALHVQSVRNLIFRALQTLRQVLASLLLVWWLAA